MEGDLPRELDHVKAALVKGALKIVSDLPTWRGEAEFLGTLYESRLFLCNFESDGVAFSLYGITACQTVTHIHFCKPYSGLKKPTSDSLVTLL